MSYTAGIIGSGGVAGMGVLGVQDPEEIGNTKVDNSHAGGYDASDDVELAAVADVDQEKLDRFGDVWEIPPDRRYLGHEQMLAEEDLNIVSVCTPTYLHHQHSVDAAISDADPDVIWCEKPIASCVADGEEMVEVCDRTDTKLLINHTSRFSKSINDIRRLVREEGLLGDIRSASGEFRMELMRNSTHLLDTLVYILDSEPERIMGYINGKNEARDALGVDETVDDAGGGGTIVTTDNVFITIDCTVEREFSTMFYHLTGTEGKLYLNTDDRECRYWALEDGSHREQPVQVDFPENSYTRSFAKAVDHAVDLIEEEARNRSSGREALQSLRVICGFYISHYTGASVTLPLDRPLKDISIVSW